MDSLLSLVVQDEKVNQLLDNLRQSVVNHDAITLSEMDMLYIKRKFQEGIEIGEKGLHELSFDVMKSLADIADAKTTLIVWGRCPNKEHLDINKSYTNINLSHVMSSKYMDSMIAWSNAPVCKVCKKKMKSIASFNQYRFDKDYDSGLKILLTRIKTTSNVCYKIADMVFDIDRMFHHDKIINKYTQTLMDMYGIKIAFQKKENIFETIKMFNENSDIEVIETKDYLDENRKQSGYEAYKIVIKKKTQLFELQLQTLHMLEVERSYLKASHRTYKEKLMEDRKKLGLAYENLYNILLRAFSASEEISVEHQRH